MLAEGALLLLLATAPGTPVLASGFTVPEPGMLEELRRRHRPGQVLRVTSGAARFELRAFDLDARGLAAPTAYGHTVLPNAPLRWENIERIDILTNRRTYGRIMGSIVGGLGGLLLPAIPSGYPTDQPTKARDYFFAGALIGGFAGGYLGSRNIRERPLYVAQDAPAVTVAARVQPTASAAADSASATADSSAAGATPIIANPMPSDPAPAGPEVQRAIRHIDSGHLLRIEGPFGRFHGYAARASLTGLSGLRSEPSLQSVEGLRALGWKDIERIDVRGGSAGQGALKGALIVGSGTAVLGALLGMAVDSMGGGAGGPGPAFAGGAIGLAMGGAVGALFGTAIGAGVPSWHNVYVRQ